MNLFHTMGAIPAPDVDKSRCVVLWGLNPAASAMNRYRRTRATKKGGATLIVVDPRTTALARQADIHVQLRPGSDGALALGILHILVKEGLYDQEFVKEHTLGFDDLTELLEDYPAPRVADLTWVPEAQLIEAARA